jgi:hypothetical protein
MHQNPYIGSTDLQNVTNIFKGLLFHVAQYKCGFLCGGEQGECFGDANLQLLLFQ